MDEFILKRSTFDGLQHSLADLREVAEQAANGLKLLHQKAHVHKDVKMENFVVRPVKMNEPAIKKWVCKLTDLANRRQLIQIVVIAIQLNVWAPPDG